MANQVVENCGFHHIALGASDFKKSLAFYTDCLGFTVYRQWETAAGGTIALLDMGNGEYVELFSDKAKTDYPLEVAGNYFHLALKTTNTQAAFQKAVAFGATVHKEPMDCMLPSEPPVLATIAFVQGPDGELIEFFQTNE